MTFFSSLSRLGITPTSIQRKSIPFLLESKNAVIAAETGSGKTFCYLIPIMQKVSKNTCAIVMVPTNELAEQVCAQAIQLNPAFFPVTGLHDVFENPKILISTPKSIYEAVFVESKKSNNAFRDLHTIVVDEADALITNEDYAKSVEKVLLKFMGKSKNSKNISSNVQLIMAGATLRNFEQKFKKLASRLNIKSIPIISDGLHKTPEKLKEVFIEVTNNTKQKILLEVLQKTQNTLIFTNTIESCNKLTEFLIKSHFNVKQYHSELTPQERSEMFFNMPRIVVCTDVLSRGVNLNVSHVIQYDFAKDACSYLHRVGRTCRGNSSGTSISFCLEEEKPLWYAIKLCSLGIQVNSVHEIFCDLNNEHCAEWELKKSNPLKEKASLSALINGSKSWTQSYFLKKSKFDG